MSDWFKSWFDSPYYHILYKYRNDAEANPMDDCFQNVANLTPYTALPLRRLVQAMCLAFPAELYQLPLDPCRR